MSAPASRSDRLLAELTGSAGLSAADAHRAAFVAFAMSRGWTKARIARYLGISRARVGQKADKLSDYVIEKPGMETLARVLAVAATVGSERRGTDDLVRYHQADWENEDFARPMVDMVA